MPELRVVDAGEVGAYRSQSLWHGLAEAAVEGAPPTLSFCRSREPYVGLGYHHPLSSLDLEIVRRRGLPVIRRQIGGGAVWVDSDQLLFQLTLPAGDAPPAVARLYERCLGPAVDAFRALGLPAELRGPNDIAVQGRKVSGTGAGRIGGGVTVVGNVIFRFPHERMVEVLALGKDRAFVGVEPGKALKPDSADATPVRSAPSDARSGGSELGREPDPTAGKLTLGSSAFGDGGFVDPELGRTPGRCAANGGPSSGLGDAERVNARAGWGLGASDWGGARDAALELANGATGNGVQGSLRGECLRLMRRWVSSLEDEGAGVVTLTAARRALVEAYAAAFGPRVRWDRPTARELAAMERWERRLADPEWLAGVSAETSYRDAPAGPVPSGAASPEAGSSRGKPATSGAMLPSDHHRAVKIAAGVWLFAAGGPDLRMRASLVEGRIERLAVEGSRVNGAGPVVARALRGQPLEAGRLAVLLEPFGSLGTRLSVLLEGAAVLR